MTSPRTPQINRLQEARDHYRRQERTLEIGQVIEVDRSKFPFLAKVRVYGTQPTYDIPDCVVCVPWHDGPMLGADLRPIAAEQTPTFRERQTVVLLTGGQLDGQTYIIAEVPNQPIDGGTLKSIDTWLLDYGGAFEVGDDHYLPVYLNGEIARVDNQGRVGTDGTPLGVRAHRQVDPPRLYFHDQILPLPEPYEEPAIPD